MHVTATLSDGSTIEADIKAGDWVRFERKFGFRVSDLGVNKVDEDGKPVLGADGTPVREVSPEARADHDFYLAYLALSRTKQFPGDYEAFLDAIDELGSEDEAGPLDGPNNSSPPSPPEPDAVPPPSP